MNQMRRQNIKKDDPLDRSKGNPLTLKNSEPTGSSCLLAKTFVMCHHFLILQIVLVKNRETFV
ncbi:MAG: hypothetical protein ACI9FG_000077 [Crocinitomicaceae bacterium]|jgi:hypothetical protein